MRDREFIVKTKCSTQSLNIKDQIKNIKYRTVGTGPNSNTPNTQMHYLAWYRHISKKWQS
jgi:hypothetical protein